MPLLGLSLRFFAIAITIISVHIRNVHMDTDAVFLGNIELTNIKVLKKLFLFY